MADALIPLALRASRDLAPKLREALRDVPTERLAEWLMSAKKDDRERASWLTARRDPSAVPALLVALRKEKSDAVRAAIIGALKASGADAPIDRGALERAAATALAKG